MDLNQLRYFCAVAECKSVSRAAELLFITQPALSKVILKLEAEVGVQLFDRRKDGMALNANGQRLLQCANSIFSELDCCMLELAQNARRRIRIISNNDYGLTSEFDYIQALYPDLNISYVFDSVNACMYALHQGECDIMLVEIRDGQREGLERLYQTKWCVLAHRDHPITQQRHITPEILAHELIYVGNDRDKQFMLSLFNHRKLQYRPLLGGKSTRSHENYINRGIAIGVVPYDIFYTLKIQRGATPIVALPLALEEGDPTYGLYIQYANGFPGVEAEAEVAAALRSNIQAQWARVLAYTESSWSEEEKAQPVKPPEIL